MPITDFNKQKETLINDIKAEITEEKELEALVKLLNKLMARKAAKAKKAQKAYSSRSQVIYSRTRVPSITSLQSTVNITHEEALQELRKTIALWK